MVSSCFVSVDVDDARCSFGRLLQAYIIAEQGMESSPSQHPIMISACHPTLQTKQVYEYNDEHKAS